MKQILGGLTDSGCGTAGFRAVKKGWTCPHAVSVWRKRGKNSLWVRGAIRAYLEAGGKVPKNYQLKP